MIRLNIGCGHKIRKGYINIDQAVNYCQQSDDLQERRPDVEADIRNLPFPDKYADIAEAIHVIEHFQFWEVPQVLNEWKRVLKPGGTLVLELPDLNKIIFWFSQKDVEDDKTLLALYGDPSWRDVSMMHKWAYTANVMKHIMKECGFVDVKEEYPQFHKSDRDMRLVGKRPNETAD